MIDISIYASSISRDVFKRYDSDNRYNIKRYLSDISPLSLFGEKNIFSSQYDNIMKINAPNFSAFSKRNFILDINKTGFDYLFEEETDYFVLDLAVIRFCLYFAKEKNIYFTQSVPVSKIYNNAENILQIENPEVIKPTDISEENLEKCLKEMCDQILFHYSVDKIILLQVLPAKYAVYKNFLINMSEQNFKQDYISSYPEIISMAYDFCSKYLSGCWCIELDERAFISDVLHHYSYHPLHYINEIYKYYYDAILIITNQTINGEKKKSQLLQLKNEVENLIDTRLTTLNTDCTKIIFNLKSFNWAEKYDLSSRMYLEVFGQRYASINYLGIIQKQYGLNILKTPEELLNSNNLNEYITFISKNRDYVVLLSVRDTANRYWNKFTTKNLLGLKCDLSSEWRKSYVAICNIEDEKYLELEKPNGKRINYAYSFFSSSHALTSQNIENCIITKVELHRCVNCLLISKGRGGDVDYSNIFIDNIDYSLNMIGLNIVVYDKKQRGVIDSINVNLWNDSELKINRKRI